MSTVIVHCCQCGMDYQDDSKEVLILHNKTWDEYTYRIFCKCCKQISIHPLKESKLDILTAIGVPIMDWESPFVEEITGPPINLTDLEEFKKELYG